jgi:hypothetical protein
MSQPSSRLFSCVRCHQQAVICSSCDRGNIHCSKACSTASRTEKQRASNQRYQKTRRGRELHAKRAYHYRRRQKEKRTSDVDSKRVTEQGSPPPIPDAVLPDDPPQTNPDPGSIDSCGLAVVVRVCCCCRTKVSDWFRQDFIRRRSSSSSRQPRSEACHDHRRRRRRQNPAAPPE